ncbi:MAG: hypothetical protein H7306_15265, partial [Bacteriovorax sp.]|nr:hypothetical protein [Rhizobacter sp.]
EPALELCAGGHVGDRVLLPIGNRPAFRTAWLALQRIGAIVVPAYLAGAQARAREFTAAFWHSRDVGSVDADGFVRIVDRTKDMLNRGGSTPDSAEVDNVLMARRGRGHDLWQALPGAGRARARLRPPPPAPNPSTTRSGATAPSAGPATRCPKASPGARARYRGAPTASC